MPFFDCNKADIPLIQSALFLVSILEKAGFESWFVGGCVRDTLLHRPISDIDIATQATWTEVQNVAYEAGLPTFCTGIKFGTITVGVPYKQLCDNQTINCMIPFPLVDRSKTSPCTDLLTFEVTTFRNEDSYVDGRHPQSVTFCNSIEQDLARRDFCINAIAWHPKRGFCDPYHGASDIEHGIIRAVGKPLARFSEDALRILRACRFESQLGFTIEEQTYAAALKQRDTLQKLPSSRVACELQLFVCGEHIRKALLDCVDILFPILPEVFALKGYEQNTKYHCYDVLEHTAYALSYSEPDPLLRWALLFHDIGKPKAHYTTDNIDHFKGHAKIGGELTYTICKRLGFSKPFSRKLVTLVTFHDDKLTSQHKDVKHFLVKLDEDPELFRTMCKLKIADSQAHAPGYQQRARGARKALDSLDEILNNNEPWRIKDLAVNGGDLIDFGIQAGPEIGRTLALLRDAVIDGRVENTREHLLSFAQKLQTESRIDLL